MPILKVQPITSQDPRKDPYPAWHRLPGHTTKIRLLVIFRIRTLRTLAQGVRYGIGCHMITFLGKGRGIVVRSAKFDQHLVQLGVQIRGK